MVADLYIRVSTDEQADRGYSQRHQEDVLRKYCEINNIKIRQVLFEDHSAKTFNRPVWKKYLLDLRKHKNIADFVLFTKWDRFSRNTEHSYQMISTLRRLGLEPQAIEQPLDLSIPENKMMLAFYLAAPEVENARRALNVLDGMHRARKEGRWMGSAVFGYANKTREDGTKYIAPKEPDASVMRWVFNELARGIFNTEQVWRMARKRGFSKLKANFWQIIRNPVYCGKIIVPKYKNEEATLAKGLHEPLISEQLFYQVQDVLNGRKRTYRTRMEVDEQIPLRGFLICPRCGRNLSASASTGYSARYYYYHCTAKCGFRHRAEKVNADFEEQLRKYTPHAGIVDLYKQIININYFNKNKGKRDDLQRLKEQLTHSNNELVKARKLLLQETIDASDFKAIKAECEENISRLERNISTLSQKFNSLEIKQLLEKATTSIATLHALYHDADVLYKRDIISAIYPQKLEYDGHQFRTIHLNEVIATIFSLDAAFRKDKSGQNGHFSILSAREVPSRFELL